MNVVVTGGGRGLGRAIAAAFARDGHRVLINYRSNKDAAEKTARDIRAAGGDADAIQADVSQPDQARAILRRAVDAWGSVDVLVNNAGLARDRTILKMTVEEWREVIDVNLNGAFWCLKAAAEEMSRRKEGCILNISSHLALRGSVGNANYVAAKAGLIGLTKAAARELGRFNVRVNAVFPGFHPTDMGKAVWEKHRDAVLAEHVLGKLVDETEFADFVVFLSKQKSVSGQIFPFESRLV